MRKFQYRIPRYSVDLPVQIHLVDRTLVAHCKELSKDGMKVEIPIHLETGTCGRASFRYFDRDVEVGFRVAQSEWDRDGIRLIFASDGDRGEVAGALAVTAQHLLPRCS